MSLAADDIAAFFDPDMPGYALATVGGTEVAALFSAAYADALGIASSGPALRAQTSTLPAVAQGTAVVVDGTSYTVAAVKPNGTTGVTLLDLLES